MSQNTQTSNKRIAKNTMYLYLRMFISLALSLVTGRVVLRTLGVDDYGINAVVGGVMDKLILYSILTFCVSTLMIALNRIYCVRHFPETRYHFIWDKSLLKPIFAFSGWDILGNVAVMDRGEGVTLLINMFFGTALNAAAGIANTVTSAVGGFSGNSFCIESLVRNGS